MDLNVSITVSLSEATLDVIRQFAPDMPEKVCDPFASHQDLKTFIKETVYEFLRDLQEHAKKPVEEPMPETAQSPVPEQKAAPASPQAPAQAEEKEITDADLRQAVKAAKDRTSAKAVREIFAKFNIAASIECPKERRSDLMAALESLK